MVAEFIFQRFQPLIPSNKDEKDSKSENKFTGILNRLILPTAKKLSQKIDLPAGAGKQGITLSLQKAYFDLDSNRFSLAPSEKQEVSEKLSKQIARVESVPNEDVIGELVKRGSELDYLLGYDMPNAETDTVVYREMFKEAVFLYKIGRGKLKLGETKNPAFARFFGRPFRSTYQYIHPNRFCEVVKMCQTSTLTHQTYHSIIHNTMVTQAQTVTTNLRIKKAEWEQVKALAGEAGLSFNEYVNTLIRSVIAKKELGYTDDGDADGAIPTAYRLHDAAGRFENDKPLKLNEDDEAIYG